MRTLTLSKRYHTIGQTIKKETPTPELYQIYKEFDEYQRKNYSTNPVKCLCGSNNQYIISTVDRERWEYPLVICRSWGLILAKDYWDEKSVIHFYSNWFRKKYGGDGDPHNFYKITMKQSQLVWDFVNDYTCKLKRPYTVFDIGGAAGGVIDLFKSDNNCYVIDYNKSYLKHAEKMGIKTVEGGIDKLYLIEEKPDLVVLSHVLEHISNLNKELETLIEHLKIGSLVYVELPGIDSLKIGRRSYDFLGDIHIPHVFYSCIKY